MQKQGEHYLDILQNIQIGVTVIDTQTGTIQYANARFHQDMNIESAVGIPYQDVFWPEFIPFFQEICQKAQETSSHSAVYFWSSKMIWEQVHVQKTLWDQRDAILMTITNITEVCRADYERQQRDLLDPQLGLPNSKKLNMDIAQLQQKDDLGMIHMEIFRLAYMKAIYGWKLVGPLLRDACAWLQALAPRESRLYRTGEGEFTLFFPDATLAQLKQTAAEIVAHFSRAWTVSAYQIHCDLLVGVAHGDFLAEDPHSIILLNKRERLDGASRMRGYILYDKSDHLQVQQDIRLQREIVDSIHQGMRGFSVAYQPIVDARTLDWAGFEALCRWQTAEGLPISPGYFIPVAEELGLVSRIDRWVRQTAIQACKDMGFADKTFFLNLNLSPTQKVDQTYIDELAQDLRLLDYPKGKLNLEITESAKVEYLDDPENGYHQLARDGYTLSLDDFGTGYSSLEELRKLPVKILKTEGQFVKRLQEDLDQQYLMQALISLSHVVDKRVIAEGIETEGQMQLLQNFGVDFFQGFLFSKPLPQEGLSAFLSRFQDVK